MKHVCEDETVLQVVEYEKPADIPECGLYSVWTDYGNEYDCEYEVGWFCEECLCNWDMGGWKDPRCPEKYIDSDA